MILNRLRTVQSGWMGWLDGESRFEKSINTAIIRVDRFGFGS